MKIFRSQSSAIVMLNIILSLLSDIDSHSNVDYICGKKCIWERHVEEVRQVDVKIKYTS